jgi:hypothetical protein
MAKYPLTELGYVARDFATRHIMLNSQLAEAITKATGFKVTTSSFQQAIRNERGYDALRKTAIEYMRERDPTLVEASLEAYAKIYGRKDGVGA